MKSMSDFCIWIEEILVNRGWDIDDPEVNWCINRHQGYLMSMYAGDCHEGEVARAFAGFWHRGDAVELIQSFDPKTGFVPVPDNKDAADYANAANSVYQKASMLPRAEVYEP